MFSNRFRAEVLPKVNQRITCSLQKSSLLEKLCLLQEFVICWWNGARWI